MISDQFIEPMVKSVREGNLRVPLDRVFLRVKEGEALPLDIPVEVQQGSGGLHCLMRINPATIITETLSKLIVPPRTEPVAVVSKDYLQVEGKTPQALSVVLDGLSPVTSNQQISLAGIASSQIHSFSFQRIHFPPSGADSLNIDELLDLRHEQKVKGGAPDQPREPRKSEPEEEYFAIIPGVKLQIRPDATVSNITHPYRLESIHTSCNCFYGKIAAGEFCLEDKDGDLWVYFRRPLNAAGTIPSAASVFEGILKAVGFTHCVHPWPYFRQHRVDHRVEERWVRPPQACEMDGLLPMCEGRLRQATDSRNLFIKAVEFFAAGDERSEVFDRALWLLHASNPNGMAFEIRVLTLCSVLEGLVKEHAGGSLGSNLDPWKRAVANLCLDWDGWFEKVFQSWKDYRNKLAHGFDVLPSATNPIDIAHVYSRIFAAIYVIMARQMGYTGKLEASMLENRDAIVLAEKSSSVCSPQPAAATL